MHSSLIEGNASKLVLSKIHSQMILHVGSDSSYEHPGVSILNGCHIQKKVIRWITKTKKMFTLSVGKRNDSSLFFNKVNPSTDHPYLVK